MSVHALVCMFSKYMVKKKSVVLAINERSNQKRSQAANIIDLETLDQKAKLASFQNKLKSEILQILVKIKNRTEKILVD